MNFPYLAYAASLSILLPLIVGLVRLRRLQEDLKLLLTLLFINGAAVFLQYRLSLAGINNLWISHFYSLIEYNMMILLLSDWQENAWTRNLFRVSMLVFTAFWVFSKLFLEHLYEPAVYANSVSRVLLVVASVYSLVGVAQSKTLTFLENPRFWILAAILIASSGGLTFNALRGLIIRLPREQLLMAFSVHWSLIVVENLIFTGGFLCKPPQ